jgi:VacB/RNase II family 3'-5' exoribonuclease
MSQPMTSGRARLRSIAKRAMVERGLLPDYSAGVLAEVGRIGRAASEAGPSIRDLRSLLWASIDNDDSRDLDQLTVAVPDGEAVKILVAVADVDAVVKRGSAIDGHARANTTSVYTAAEVFSMLPEKLSTDLTSLGQGQERLAIVTELSVSPDGVVHASEVYRALVKNQAKLAYDSVAAWLDGTGPAPAPVKSVPGLDEQLRIQDRVAQTMKEIRHRAGALTLQTSQSRAVFEGEALEDLQEDEKNRAKELIEDFMIAANTAIAHYLDGKRFPSLRRVLRSPERWQRIVELAAASGAHLPPEPTAGALEDFLKERRRADPERFPDLSLSVGKLLGRGEYVMERPGERALGHFGLAVKDYTHSTAPNRRFPDVITQRLLKAALAGAPPPYSEAELGELARHCTEQEDQASKVERQVGKSAAALLLTPRLREQFDAIVTGASVKGTWVRIARPPVEGRVVRGFAGLDVGNRVRVVLVHTDVERGHVDFERVNDG